MGNYYNIHRLFHKMVWAFVAGISIGLPVGCYFREQGYSKKMKSAWRELNPIEDEFKTDNIDPYLGDKKRIQYRKDLQTGMAKPEDFERYIYGGTYDRKFFTDDTDRQIDEARARLDQWERAAKGNIDASIAAERRGKDQ